ncbi:DUF1846 domain-containing protein [Ruminococcus sp.]|uniref:DUF1846 domain-containing protein n=1 Tax=Ruminococcus sp. TaxID=41978 RepID=UPI002E77F2D9|nr:DUF1846 domain-containing protein [Ruminococcus sp.]MBQ2093253.1 DUF1846 domain-containing protein [Ruminococcus sp.]MEE1261934.1 DUF1846 domain-containing protein [Ruminococcus sp.]
MKIGFDNNQYLETQSQHIRDRIAKFGGKLYLEFGGKLFDDYHASRVLPGFKPDSKLQMLMQLKDEAEIVIVINADDIEKNKVRGDLGITYDLDVLRLLDLFRSRGLCVNSVVLTRFADQPTAIKFEKHLTENGINVYHHYSIPNYPTDVDLIVSDEGYGKNDFVETSRKLVVITAPGPGSGKMAVCLSQLYHEHKHGVKAGYAKFETFPIWNLPLKHPVNVAYEAATADLNDVNMIDPFHLEAYGKTTVNYNRDIEIFPVLNTMFEQILGESPYKSPTDMGVNMAGNCIIDDDAVCAAANQEIIRRYYAALCNHTKGVGPADEAYKIGLLMKQNKLSTSDRKVVAIALDKAEATGAPAAAIELADGRILTGKTTNLLGACAAMLLNALKSLAKIPKEVDIIDAAVIEPIQKLKVESFGSNNPRLHTDEILIALSMSAVTNPTAKLAMAQLPKLKDTEAHATVILSETDTRTLKKLGIRLTTEPAYETDRLYRK